MTNLRAGRPSARCRRIGVPHSSEHSDARVRVSRVSTDIAMVGSGPGLAVIVTFIVHIVEIDALLVPRGHSGLWQVGSGYRSHAPLVSMDPGGLALDPTAALNWVLSG